jgi:hypothetical protein
MSAARGWRSAEVDPADLPGHLLHVFMVDVFMVDAPDGGADFTLLLIGTGGRRWSRP